MNLKSTYAKKRLTLLTPPCPCHNAKGINAIKWIFVHLKSSTDIIRNFISLKKSVVKSRNIMDGGGRQSRLLGRLLGKLRGDHHRYTTLDKNMSFTSSVISEDAGCGSNFNDDHCFETSNVDNSCNSTSIDDHQFAANIDLRISELAGYGCTSNDNASFEPYGTYQGCDVDVESPVEESQLPANIDLRYGGQYLTPEQLPEFCDQLRHLVQVIRNIQSYARVTGEYPSELERRLEQEAKEVAALAAEVRNARDVVTRTRAQRRAVRAHKQNLNTHLASLRETEVRELESSVRLSDRKLFKTWETLKESTDPAAFEPLLNEIRNKQTALECLVRLIESRRSNINRVVLPPQPLPPPMSRDENEEPSSGVSGGRRHENRRSCKRRRKEARSVPLSSEPSRHSPPPQVTLYIQGTECTSRYRVGSAGAVALPPLDLPSRGSVRDILFFSAH
ncbi:uncharacterized protein LOC128678368 isoform X1 [Plodia interpunctella]|uniref:uncharacterized protein LOC128678368 isoform X1 n=1 Tax=Plodia interpunctella TaxID=58824 RepID=UPI002368D8FD|nr:uncharacterized protein LOC128678368 isoform X1 [Plodia interpunctella]